MHERRIAYTRAMLRVRALWPTMLALLGCSDRALSSGVDTSGSVLDGTAGTLEPSDPVSSTTVAEPPPMPTTAASATSESSATSTTTTDDGEPEPDPGCLFICAPDAGPPIESCTPGWDDCLDGQKCVWYAPGPDSLRRDAARCIDIAGEVPAFAACSLPNGIGPEITDDCDATSYCLEVYGTADHGFCAPYRTDNGCDDYPGSWYAAESGSEFPAACLYYECNPLSPSLCPADMTCTYYPAFLYGSLMCWVVPEPAALPIGAACDYGECGEGELCLAADLVPNCAHDRCCTEWCDIGMPECSDRAASCESFPGWFSRDPEFASLGACALPDAFG